mgnify:CR=1 FL=1
MDPDDFLVVRIVWDVFDTLFIRGRRSVFLYLFIVLVWVSVIGAVVLLEPGPPLGAALVGSGVCATFAALLINWKIQPKR